ncbi:MULTISPECIES: tetratricopeptide repeat protein [Cytobacillus]|uniref:tetratricopeptide repeat protein n=1 Tax=Cytobacillus TaxID=2675230 RepID=UPI0020405C3F|nr:hypothetical protein [Cytobacillus firmus]MCM3706950.1 hypothetical protein [Cytobacillus firmus]
MIDTFLFEYEKRNKDIIKYLQEGKVTNNGFYQLAISQLEQLNLADPENPVHLSHLAEYHHLDGHLRKAGDLYRKVLEIDPLQSISKEEKRFIQKFCPNLLVTPNECFPLKDVAAIHHPSKPLIGYHLFWEDDYDFPDDYEPCDHEEVWVQYDPLKEEIVKVMCWFHARVIESEPAVEEAKSNCHRPVIRIEWGKHGSLLCGWQEMNEPLTGIPIKQWLRETFTQVKTGGRVPDHPLKRFWPAGFEGTFEEYINFSVPVDPLEWLQRKPLMFKTRWVNAAIGTNALHYNFHPKMEWPDRFYESSGVKEAE